MHDTIRELDEFLDQQDPVEWGETDYPATHAASFFAEASEADWQWLHDHWGSRSNRWLENLAWALAEAPAERAVPLIQQILAATDRGADYYWQLRESLEDLTGGPKHQVSLADVKELMSRSGRGLADCRFALAETGTVDAAMELLGDESS